MSASATNEHGQPIGPALYFTAAPHPKEMGQPLQEFHGRVCVLKHLDDSHSEPLRKVLTDPIHDKDFTYMPYSQPKNQAEWDEWFKARATPLDPFVYAICARASSDSPLEVLGQIGYLNIFPNNGTIEIGHVLFSPKLQRSRVATEAVYLLINAAFEGGYRRVEWKCDALNARSRRAAERFGMEFEGIFRQHWVYKGRSRDTAWFAIIDKDWTWAQKGYEAWLSDDNFDEKGMQKRTLEQCRGDRHQKSV